MSLDNVIHEVFTRVSAGWVPLPSPAVGSIGNRTLTFSFSQEKIIEVQCDLLISNFRDPKTITLLKENIGHIFDGSLSHCVDTLTLGLRKALDLKKQRIGVKLRCSWAGCSLNSDPVLYSSVGSNIYCPRCNDGERLKCANCGWNRTDDYTLCRGCGKWFV